MNWKEILALVASIGTLASPIDLVPEAILGPIGLSDDLIAVVVAGFTLYKAVKVFRESRAAKAAGGTAEGAAGGAAGTAGGAKEAPGAAKPAGPPPSPGKGSRIIVDPGEVPGKGQK
jgi:uncharacterized membrane protein YkvA (DUF1232 family)